MGARRFRAHLRAPQSRRPRRPGRHLSRLRSRRRAQRRRRARQGVGRVGRPLPPSGGPRCWRLPRRSWSPGRRELIDELVREEGKTLAEATMEVTRTPMNLRFYAGEAMRTTGATYPSAGEQPGVHAARAGRRRRRDHPVELPAQHPLTQARAGAGRRQRRGVQAVRGHAADRPATGRGAARRRTARRRDRVSCRATAPPARRSPPIRGSPPSRSPVRPRSGEAHPRARSVRTVAVQLEMGGKNPVVVAGGRRPRRAPPR